MQPHEMRAEKVPELPDAPAEIGDDLPGSIERINHRLDLLTDQVDVLQVESAQRSRPWWREPSLIISAVALVISALFSAIGMRQVSAKDMAAKQESLRQTVVQIVESQAEMTEAAQENSGNPLMARWANANVNAKRQVQIETALALIDQLGDRVDASTLVPLAGQLQADGRYEESLSLYFKALGLVGSPIVRSTILRSIGWSYRIAGSNMYDVSKSRDYLQRAVDLFQNQDDDASRFYLADNLMFWAELELANGEVGQASSLFEHATDAAEAMSLSNSARQAILLQIRQAQSNPVASAQAATDLVGQWQVRFPDSTSKQGSARITYDQASGTYYISMLVLRDGVVLENRSGSGATPDPGTLLIQWQGTRFSDQFQVTVQASGLIELAISLGGQVLSGTDSAVGDLQQAIVLTRVSP